jgi:hypothetical protein
LIIEKNGQGLTVPKMGADKRQQISKENYGFLNPPTKE